MSKTETQSEAMKLSALLNVAMAFDHGRFGTDRRFVEMDATVVASVDAELRRLDARLNSLEFAFNEWHAKTDWVQETAQARELGMHRADVLRSRIEALDAENKALRERLEAQAFVPPGFALVPVEPTKEMVAAACRDHGYPGGSRSAYVLGYRSMLAAAPQAAAKTGDAA